jgi:predicted acylesterase/phospholipase RssA
MSIQAYNGPSSGSSHGAIVPVGAAQELTQEEYEKRQKDVSFLSLIPVHMRDIYF